MTTSFLSPKRFCASLFLITSFSDGTFQFDMPLKAPAQHKLATSKTWRSVITRESDYESNLTDLEKILFTHGTTTWQYS